MLWNSLLWAVALNGRIAVRSHMVPMEEYRGAHRITSPLLVAAAHCESNRETVRMYTDNQQRLSSLLHWNWCSDSLLFRAELDARPSYDAH